MRLVDAAVGGSGDVDNLVAILDLANSVTATVDLSRNSRYGDDIRTEILGSQGALLIDSMPTGRTRVATAEGIHVLEDSRTEDVMANGIANQARAFVSCIRGETIDVPTAVSSARAVAIGRAIQRSAETGLPESVSIG
jgi:predicted dehydrogenase